MLDIFLKQADTRYGDVRIPSWAEKYLDPDDAKEHERVVEGEIIAFIQKEAMKGRANLESVVCRLKIPCDAHSSGGYDLVGRLSIDAQTRYYRVTGGDYEVKVVDAHERMLSIDDLAPLMNDHPALIARVREAIRACKPLVRLHDAAERDWRGLFIRRQEKIPPILNQSRVPEAPPASPGTGFRR